MTDSIQVAHFVCPTEAEGPGSRMAIWVQGCPLRCPNCCNPEMLGSRGGRVETVSSLLDQAATAGDSIEGLTFLGGEPFVQAAGLAALASGVQRLGLSVMIFSGHTLDELSKRRDPDTDALLAGCDLLVDGPYVREKPDHVRRWIGSRNQVMHFMTDRYQPSDPRFVSDESFEIRYLNGRLTVNGWPASSDQVAAVLRPRRA